jgi:hypothetical protein
MPDGSYQRAPGAGKPGSHGAQDALMGRYAARDSVAGRAPRNGG